MQIIKAEITPIELKLRHPVCMAGPAADTLGYRGFPEHRDAGRQECLGLHRGAF